MLNQYIEKEPCAPPEVCPMLATCSWIPNARQERKAGEVQGEPDNEGRSLCRHLIDEARLTDSLARLNITHASS